MVLLLLKIPGNMHLPAVLQISFFSRSLDVQIPGARHTDQWPFPVHASSISSFSYISVCPQPIPDAHLHTNLMMPAGSQPDLSVL